MHLVCFKYKTTNFSLEDPSHAVDAPSRARRRRRNESRYPRDAPSNNQRVDVVRPLVRVDRLEVHAVAYDMILVLDAVSS